jgi:hypothetical protein
MTEHSMDSKSRFYALEVCHERARLPSSRTRYATPVKKEYWESRDGARLCTARLDEIDEIRGRAVSKHFQREIPHMHERLEHGSRLVHCLEYVILAVHRCAEHFSADGFLST